MTRLLLLLLVAASGCVLPRVAKLDLPPPRLDDPEVHATWKVGEVLARAKPGVDTNGRLRDYAPLKDQLEARMRETLEGQAGLGHRAELAECGYKVVFVPFEHGKPEGLPVDVLTGFLTGEGAASGRPVGLALDASGALLVADDVGNVVWRVSPLDTSSTAGADLRAR